MSAVPLLEGENIVVVAGKRTLLNVPRVTVGRGMCLGIVGINGSGKSTLLRVLAGRQRPKSGIARFEGIPVKESDARFRENVAVFADDAKCFADLSVLEHLEMVSSAFGQGPATETCEAVLTRLGLGDRIEAFPDNLSAGQRQMLLLGAMLVRPAKLLMLDEPEQRLDSSACERLAAQLREHVDAGTSIVMAVHDPIFLGQVADKAIVLEGGEIAGTGTPAEVAERGLTPWS